MEDIKNTWIFSIEKNPTTSNKKSTKKKPTTKTLSFDSAWKNSGLSRINDFQVMLKAEKEFTEKLFSIVGNKQSLMWDIILDATRKLNPAHDKTFTKKQVRSIDGREYTIFKNKNYTFLAHFSSLENSKKILEMEEKILENPQLKNNKNYFWKDQQKISCSLVQENRTSFNAHKNREGVGFIIDVPDPSINILHSFCRDVWSPVFVDNELELIKTGQGSKENVQAYINIMYRYKAISSLVHNMFLNTEQAITMTTLFDKLLTIQEKYKQYSEYQYIKHQIRHILENEPLFFLKPEAFTKALQNMKDDLRKSKQYHEETDEDFLVEKIEKMHITEKKDVWDILEEKIDELLHILEHEYLRSPHFLTSTKYLIDRTESLTLIELKKINGLAASILKKHPQLENALFKHILQFSPQNEENLMNNLEKMQKDLFNFMHRSYFSVHKRQRKDMQIDIGIFSKILTPTELLHTTPLRGHNEVTLLGNDVSKACQAKPCSFKGVVVERAFIHQGKISNALADVLDIANKLKFPLIYI